MKALMCITVLCIANVNGALRSWDEPDWVQEANSFTDFLNGSPDTFKSFVDSMPDTAFVKLYEGCTGGLVGIATSAELNQCLTFIFGGLMEEDKLHDLYKFADKVTDNGDNGNLIDTDKNGSLDGNEFKYLMSLLAAADALTVLDAYDTDANEALDSDELQNYYPSLTTWIGQLGVSANQWAAIKSVLATEQSRGYMSMFNFANFFVQMWAILSDI